MLTAYLQYFPVDIRRNVCRERLSWVGGREGVKLEMNGDQGKVWNKEQGQDLADVQ